jgi:hypothetical protein
VTLTRQTPIESAFKVGVNVELVKEQLEAVVPDGSIVIVLVSAGFTELLGFTDRLRDKLRLHG